MIDIFKNIKKKLALSSRKRIVFPEVMDERVLRAANRLAEEKIVTPIYIGDEAVVQAHAEKYKLNLVNYEVLDPNNFADIDKLAKICVERRKGRIDLATAYEKLKEANYFATILVYANYADGLVSGAVHTTSTAVRPSLEIIKPKPKMKEVSGAYILVKEDEQFIFADCAIHIAPTSEQLAEITFQSAETAKLLEMEPKVAMLSFSTVGSAQSPETERITEAVKKVKAFNPSFLVDGEIQFDAAYLPALAAKKAPDSAIQGDANVFVFPSLEAGNIGCKIAERLGGFQAIGPLIQGLNRPVNLLSRGCAEDDVYKVALFTALQASSFADEVQSEK